MSVMNNLCAALTPKQSAISQPRQSALSPLKKAELLSTYIKQLSDLHQLNETGTLTQDEYEEQRVELISAMRNLKGQS